MSEYKRKITDEQKQKYKEARKHKYHNMTDEQKQKYKDYQKEYRRNMKRYMKLSDALS